MIRIISAIIMALLVIAAVWYLSAWFLNLVLIALTIIGLVEFGDMFFKDGFEKWSTVVLGTLLSAAMLFAYDPAEYALVLVVGVTLVASLLFMWRARELAGVAERLSLSVFAIIYLGAAFSFWGWLRDLPFGREFVFLGIVPACLTDTFALIFGKLIGRHKMAPVVSPNKTMEGYAGALVGAIVGVLIVWFLCLRSFPFVHMIIIAFIIWITAPMGDLIESMLKRSCGVKDSGSIIPGHGGILDRLDALIFTGPAVYAYIHYILGV